MTVSTSCPSCGQPHTVQAVPTADGYRFRLPCGTERDTPASTPTG